MIIEGKFTLKGNIEEVWESLLSPTTLASCIPGARKIEARDGASYECVMEQRVGPIAARFNVAVTLTEIDRPAHLRALGRGEEMARMGSFTQDSVINLQQVSETEVEIAYSSNVSVVGRLATFGERIMRAKAQQVGEEFTRNLHERLRTRRTAGETI